MIDWFAILIAALGGMGLGLMFFSGLHWTIRRGLAAQNPGGVFALSFLFRTALTLLGFWFLASGRAERLLACLLGFVLVRVLYGKGVTYENQSR